MLSRLTMMFGSADTAEVTKDSKTAETKADQRQRVSAGNSYAWYCMCFLTGCNRPVNRRWRVRIRNEKLAQSHLAGKQQSAAKSRQPRIRAGLVQDAARCSVGWVERSETHHCR